MDAASYWEENFSEKNQRKFWHNKLTGEKTWKNPYSNNAPSAGTPSSSSSSDRSRKATTTTSSDDHDGEAHVAHHSHTPPPPSEDSSHVVGAVDQSEALKSVFAGHSAHVPRHVHTPPPPPTKISSTPTSSGTNVGSIASLFAPVVVLPSPPSNTSGASHIGGVKQEAPKSGLSSIFGDSFDAEKVAIKIVARRNSEKLEDNFIMQALFKKINKEGSLDTLKFGLYPHELVYVSSKRPLTHSDRRVIQLDSVLAKKSSMDKQDTTFGALPTFMVLSKKKRPFILACLTVEVRDHWVDTIEALRKKVQTAAFGKAFVEADMLPVKDVAPQSESSSATNNSSSNSSNNSSSSSGSGGGKGGSLSGISGLFGNVTIDTASPAPTSFPPSPPPPSKRRQRKSRKNDFAEFMTSYTPPPQNSENSENSEHNSTASSVVPTSGKDNLDMEVYKTIVKRGSMRELVRRLMADAVPKANVVGLMISLMEEHAQDDEDVKNNVAAPISGWPKQRHPPPPPPPSSVPPVVSKTKAPPPPPPPAIEKTRPPPPPPKHPDDVLDPENFEKFKKLASLFSEEVTRHKMVLDGLNNRQMVAYVKVLFPNSTLPMPTQDVVKTSSFTGPSSGGGTTKKPVGVMDELLTKQLHHVDIDELAKEKANRKASMSKMDMSSLVAYQIFKRRCNMREDDSDGDGSDSDDSDFDFD